MNDFLAVHIAKMERDMKNDLTSQIDRVVWLEFFYFIRLLHIPIYEQFSNQCTEKLIEEFDHDFKNNYNSAVFFL